MDIWHGCVVFFPVRFLWVWTGLVIAIFQIYDFHADLCISVDLQEGMAQPLHRATNLSEHVCGETSGQLYRGTLAQNVNLEIHFQTDLSDLSTEMPSQPAFIPKRHGRRLNHC